MLIKIGNLITIIDDVYDIFGTMEELEILTDFIDRWEISGIDKLPPVIRSTYMALYNSTNEIAYRIMRDRGINVLPCLQMMYEMARGDNFKAVQCYQNQHGISMEEAREAIWSMVEEAWKNINQLEFEEYPSFTSKDYLNACMGFARGSHFFYQYGDGQGLSDKETKEYLMSLVVEPVSI
ncbi:hypothetical protein MLD38_029292 [Melastoma candidum]|uniref:Uncharacterized protein n=1 Tax=Melastoma candidum TaxID=119954 RepID=A0ACB9N5X9_9MYRT|nr:hypothetical protein MLD38_029292 [Melastoma candidum]